MIVVDTSVWIDFLRGTDSPERRMLHRLIEDEEEIAVTGIIFAEILQGIREDENFRITRDYLLGFPAYEPGSTFTYLSAARIYRTCRKKGKSIRSTIDCIIAAICLENDFVFLHKDSDFDIIEECAGLKVLHVQD
ncbi:MAG: PIN domain nuclease [Chloroflexi bacterium]|nr:PIN domain nuclease [Chloroflexota bacterium]